MDFPSVTPSQTNSIAQEPLPAYSDDSPLYTPSHEFYGIALHQVEFDTPWSDRTTAIKPVIVELNCNQLNLYELAADKSIQNAIKMLYKHQNYDDGSSSQADAPDIAEEYCLDGDAYGDDCSSSGPHMFSKLKNGISKKKSKNFLSKRLPSEVLENRLLFEPTSNSCAYAIFAAKYKGKLLSSSTLSNLNVGEAPSSMSSYYKEDRPRHINNFTMVHYRNTLRLRIEYTQMLLHFWSFHGMVHWYRNMNVGRDLASGIEERKLTTLKSIPRNFSVRNNALLEASAREAAFYYFDDAKPLHRASISSCADSCDCVSCFSSCSASSLGTSIGTSASSLAEFCENDKRFVDVYGSSIMCLEELYTPAEKQYISNCIPTLNSFDKWMGAKLTISNFEQFLPKNDKVNVNEKGKLFITVHTFNNLVRNYNKHVALQTAGVKKCKEFFVDSAGLVSLEEDA